MSKDPIIGNRYPQDTKAKAVELLLSGKSKTAVANILDVHHTTLPRIVSEAVSDGFDGATKAYRIVFGKSPSDGAPKKAGKAEAKPKADNVSPPKHDGAVPPEMAEAMMRLLEANGYGHCDPDEDLVRENVRLAKQKHKLQDIQRVERKAFREYARVENACAEFEGELVALLKRHAPHNLRPQVQRVTSGKVGGDAVGMIHLSDLHFNERVDLPHNTFDFDVAAKRIRKLVRRSKSFFAGYGIRKVVMAFTGDLLNSDRRLDELLLNSTNRAKATFLAFEILRQAIIDVAADFEEVYVAWVCGNESRVDEDIGPSQPMASNNYDFTIMNMLAVNLSDCGNIYFNVCDDPSEVVVNVAGQNVLLMHGHMSITRDVKKSVSGLKARYLERGVRIDYVIWGHIHSAYISDMFARSGGLPGDNDYSSKGLNLTGRASQNLYVFHKDGSRDGLKVDLQFADGERGYDFHEALEAYNSKAKSKLNQGETIMRIVI